MTSRGASPLLVVTMGCPSGVGPEVALAGALEEESAEGASAVLFVGDVATFRAAAAGLGLDPAVLIAVTSAEEAARLHAQRAPGAPRPLSVLQAGPPLDAEARRPGRPTAASGAAQLAALEQGYAVVRAAPRARALVTAPVNKAAIAASGARGAKRFRGHTEWLQTLDGAASTTMCFIGGGLATGLVTTHVPLAKVARLVTAEGVARASTHLAELLHALGLRRPRLAVASLNPHAGEEGLLGREEQSAIAPGIALAARSLGRRAALTGPLGAETAYREARAGAFDGVVAMYHDQATIPMKLVAFGDAVNVTAGLSIVRTSVDHGTAYDRAWKYTADPRGMLAALRLANRLLGGGR